MGGRTHGKDTKTVLAEIRLSHPDLLFDKFEYKNSQTKVIIGCTQHGYFSKYPNDMKNGKGGCPKCNNSFHKTHIDFIEELQHQHPHIKCLSTYKNATTKLTFKCTKHSHTFLAQPYTLIAGHVNCPECYSAKQTSTRFNQGLVSNPALKTEYQQYRQTVWRYSNRAYKTHMSGQIRDRHNHLDHVLSIVEGFNNNIPPEIVGSIHNLRIITGQANRHKSYKSDITPTELLERYNR